MLLSSFTDELGVDITKAVPTIKSWGLDTVDLRGRNHRCIARADTNANARKNEKKKDEKCGGRA